MRILSQEGLIFNDIPYDKFFWNSKGYGDG